MPAQDMIARVLAAEPGQTPAWAVWLFEKPIASAAVVVIASLIVFFILNQRARVRASWIAVGAGVVLGAAVFLTGRMVTTDRERIVSSSREFISAVARADSRRVRDLLDDRLVVTVTGRIAPGIGKDWVVDRAGGMGHLEIQRAITRIDRVAVRRGGIGETDIGVLVTTQRHGNASSTWTLEWRLGPDDQWRIAAMDWRTIEGQEPSLAMLMRSR